MDPRAEIENLNIAVLYELVWLAIAKGGGGGGGIPVPWTPVAAGATVAVSGQTATKFYEVDSSGAQVNLNLPAAASAVDGQEVVITLAAASVNAPVLVNAGAGTTVWEDQNPGNFGAQSVLSTQGETIRLKYEKSTTRWIAAA